MYDMTVPPASRPAALRPGGFCQQDSTIAKQRGVMATLQAGLETTRKVSHNLMQQAGQWKGLIKKLDRALIRARKEAKDADTLRIEAEKKLEEAYRAHRPEADAFLHSQYLLSNKVPPRHSSPEPILVTGNQPVDLRLRILRPITCLRRENGLREHGHSRCLRLDQEVERQLATRTVKKLELELATERQHSEQLEIRSVMAANRKLDAEEIADELHDKVAAALASKPLSVSAGFPFSHPFTSKITSNACRRRQRQRGAPAAFFIVDGTPPPRAIWRFVAGQQA